MVGAHLNDGNGGSSGHTRVYKYSSNSWSQLGSDINGEGAGDESGWDVSINDAGTRIAIGAANNDGNGSNSGHVRIFHYASDSNSWVQVQSDIDGENGSLSYRGFQIADLTDHSSFLEITYLLIWGDLPTPQQLKDLGSLK